MPSTAGETRSPTRPGRSPARRRRRKRAEACEKYARALEIKPDYHVALNGWGNALADEAGALSGAEAAAKRAEACEKYARALEIKPDYHVALNGWGNALAAEADARSGAEAAAKRAEACEKYALALEIKPGFYDALENWAGVLTTQANALDGKEAADALAEAEQLLGKAKSLTGKPSYNLACVLALTGRLEEALGELARCRADGLLPDREHLDADHDLDALRELPPFQALVDGESLELVPSG